jgi:hypothetical protein
MIRPDQCLIRPTALAAELGMDRTTLWRWTRDDIRLRACLFRPGWFSVQKLRDCGLLTAGQPPSMQWTVAQ